MEKLEQALFEIRRVIAGQEEMLERVLVCLLTGGHLLIEGVPGLAKTLTVKTTANVLGGTFNRIPAQSVDGAFKQAAQEAPEALERQRIPEDAAEMTREYFRKLSNQK